ncbi:MAG TPA: integrase arm-type DNA-binding domain-containing protein [Xanthobacteraceae bacterium]|jgi:integrase|nr:integrase arm-type DNA-binding domain-containing protein [Xanthobacteraceae bacterium]
MALNEKRIAALKEAGRYRDDGPIPGLWLQVTKAGVKSWLLRYELDHRERWMGLGPTYLVPLKAARERAREARIKLLDGVDPIEARRAERDAERNERNERITFEQATEEFLRLHEAGWTNAKHRKQWRSTLQTYAYPKLGDRPVKAIDAALINEALAPIWVSTPETASRLKQRVERVIQWVKDGKPLPAPSASKRTKNHPALPYPEIPQFMADLRDHKGISAQALEFLILCAGRTNEVIGAKREEFDLEHKIWTIPADRMKAKRPHRVPLSDRAITLLKTLPTEAGNEFMFIGPRAGKGLSNMAMLELMRGMRPDYVVHGFRSTFKDWCSEQTTFPNIVSEAALAHAIKDKTEAAYRRGDLLEKRKALMSAWARYCTTPPAKASATADVVVPLRR